MFSIPTDRLPLRLGNKTTRHKAEAPFPKADTSLHMAVKVSLLFSKLSKKVRQWLCLRSTEKKG